ncbi:MAG TPA: hypothetical protein VKX28_26870 [Xanthobacteraceae bacterium]|nr:hypothetical protein [Xanthobacteraceae bacterium]
MKLLRAARAAGAAFALVLVGMIAHASVGTQPGSGMGLVDGVWLNGLAGGQNYAYQYGITAHAGGTQAACLSITPGAYLYEVDTVASGNDSICIPYAQAGMNFSLRNAGASTLAIYAQAGTNLVTGSTDQINGSSNSTSYTLSTQNSVECFVAKPGSWSCVHGN